MQYGQCGGIGVNWDTGVSKTFFFLSRFLVCCGGGWWLTHRCNASLDIRARKSTTTTPSACRRSIERGDQMEGKRNGSDLKQFVVRTGILCTYHLAYNTQRLLRETIRDWR